MSILSRRGRLSPLRVGFWRVDGASSRYVPDVLLSAVEPSGAEILELRRLAGYGGQLAYSASRNRQCHTYAVTERRDTRSLALWRVFLRCALGRFRGPLQGGLQEGNGCDRRCCDSRFTILPALLLPFFDNITRGT